MQWNAIEIIRTIVTLYIILHFFINTLYFVVTLQENTVPDAQGTRHPTMAILVVQAVDNYGSTQHEELVVPLTMVAENHLK